MVDVEELKKKHKNECIHLCRKSNANFAKFKEKYSIERYRLLVLELEEATLNLGANVRFNNVGPMPPTKGTTFPLIRKSALVSVELPIWKVFIQFYFSSHVKVILPLATYFFFHFLSGLFKKPFVIVFVC